MQVGIVLPDNQFLLERLKTNFRLRWKLRNRKTTKKNTDRDASNEDDIKQAENHHDNRRHDNLSRVKRNYHDNERLNDDDRYHGNHHRESTNNKREFSLPALQVSYYGNQLPVKPTTPNGRLQPDHSHNCLKDSTNDAVVCDLRRDDRKDMVDLSTFSTTRDDTRLSLTPTDNTATTSASIKIRSSSVISRPTGQEWRNLKIIGKEKRNKINIKSSRFKSNETNEILRIYVHSFESDTEMERSSLLMETFPASKDYARQNGVELEIFDVRLGIMGNHLDIEGTEDQDLRFETIRQCLKGSTLNHLCFLAFSGCEADGCGYGTRPTLPVKLTPHEFQWISKALEETQDGGELIDADDRNRGAADRSRDPARRKYRPREVEVRENEDPVSFAALSPMQLELIRGKSPIDCLQTWYRLDDNSVPSLYRLQSVRNRFPDVLSRQRVVRSSALNNWQMTSDYIAQLLKKATSKLKKEAVRPFTTKDYLLPAPFLDVEECARIVKSFTDSTESNNKWCLWCKNNGVRNNDGSDDDDDDDFVGRRSHHNVTKNMAYNADRILLDLIPMNRTKVYRLPSFSSSAAAAASSSSFELEHLSSDLKLAIKAAIDDVMHENDDKDRKERVSVRVLKECEARTRHFHGRRVELEVIKRYINGEDRKPLIITGKSGCGLTSLVSQAAKDEKLCADGSPVRIVRLLGFDSYDTPLSFMRDIYFELCDILNEEPNDDVIDNFIGMSNDFWFHLKRSTKEKKEKRFLIFIDSLHDFKAENDSSKISWIPLELPPRVRLVVSTVDDDVRDDDNNNCLRLLRERYSRSDQIFLELNELGCDDVINVIDSRFDESSGRRVTSEQRQFIEKSASRCLIPLFVDQVIKEARRWPSYLSPGDIVLGATVEGMTGVLFGRLEKEHGEPFVRRALGYMTASRCGVTLNEMEDLVTLDDVVMEEIGGLYGALPVRRLPSLLLLRLIRSLGDYVRPFKVDGCTTLEWSHRRFRGLADERYLKKRDGAKSYHTVMAEYFSGRKTSHSLEEKPDAIGITTQPLSWEGHPGGSSAYGRKRYNLRRLNEQPYHLIRSQQLDALKSDCLFNLHFLLVKTASTSSTLDLQDDITSAISLDPNDAELPFFLSALRMSAEVVAREPRQLPSQLVGRLRHVIASGNYPSIRNLLSQAEEVDSSSCRQLYLPSVRCLSGPIGEATFNRLAFHSAPITAVATSIDGLLALTASLDDTVRLWSLNSGEMLKVLEGDVGSQVYELRFGSKIELAITSERFGIIRVWMLATGACIKRLNNGLDTATIATACEGQLLVAMPHGSNRIRVWNLRDGVRLVRKSTIEEQRSPKSPHPLHKDNTSVLSPTSADSVILHAFRDSDVINVYNVTSGLTVGRMTTTEPGSVTALALSRDYYISAVRHLSREASHLVTLELFDSQTLKNVRQILGCDDSLSGGLHVDALGLYVVGICCDRMRSTSYVGVWNLGKAEYRRLAGHSKVSPIGAAGNIGYVVTAASDENSLRIWNLRDLASERRDLARNREILAENGGIRRIVPIRNHPRYVSAQSKSSVFVWDLTAETIQRAEIGLFGSGDVTLIWDTLLIILTCRNLHKEEEEEKEMSFYTTIKIYNLMTGTLLKRVEHCAIPAFPENDYVILNVKQLMGMSKTRGHFIVWSLETGFILHRIWTSGFVTARPTSAEQDELEAGDGRKLSYTEKVILRGRRRRRRQQQDVTSLVRGGGAAAHENTSSIDVYLISRDLSTIVASFNNNELSVHDVISQRKMSTLAGKNGSLAELRVAALTGNGKFLVHTNYDEGNCVTLWNCVDGRIKRRLRNRSHVSAVTVSEDALVVLFFSVTDGLCHWTPHRRSSLRRISGGRSFPSMRDVEIQLTADTGRAVVRAEREVSIWDLSGHESGSGGLISVFTADSTVRCMHLAFDGQLIVLGLQATAAMTTLKQVSLSSCSGDINHIIDGFATAAGSSTFDKDQVQMTMK